MAHLDDVFFELDLPPERPFQVVSLGMNAVDWICRLPVYPPHNSKIKLDELLKLGGGPAATAGALCGRWGLGTKYVGRVGDDDVGRFSLADLRSEPMDCSDVEVIEGADSQLAVILVDRPSGERTVLWQRDPRLDYHPGQLRPQQITCGQVLHMDGNELPARAEAARWAQAAGMPVCLDIDRPGPGDRELLQSVDFALPTEAFVKRFASTDDWREGLMAVKDACPGWVGCTRGRQGVAVAWENRIVEVPSFDIRPLESTGAGDVFHGAFVYSLFQSGWSLRRKLRFSCAAGALSCTRVGARGGIPPLQEVLQLLEDNSG
ncbi:MAG TPA: carbohydrate kinase family protein [Acidobacteriota bacterium]|nr:carbohydrate kinase family protein [Acidobacteriota bacterium]